MIRRILLTLKLVKPHTRGEEKIIATLGMFKDIVDDLYSGSEEIQEEVEDKTDLAEALIVEAQHLRDLQKKAETVRTHLLNLTYPLEG